MNKLILAGAAGIAMVAIPATAQQTMQPSTMQPGAQAYEMNQMQRQMYDSFDADRKMTYDRMSMEMQQYYWTLDEPRQNIWWMLDDDQRTRLFARAPAQRDAAFNSLLQQAGMATSDSSMTGNMQGTMANNATANNTMSGSTTNSTMARTTGTSMANNTMASGSMNSSANSGMTSGNIRFVSSTVVQPTPTDAGPPTGDVPICGRNDYDNCINAWEAGRRGAGVDRPADRYPGPSTRR